MIPNKFFILVGGLGTRLQSVISNVPKPMAPVANKPFLWYKIQQLKQAGFRNFVFCVGYLGHMIQDYFKDGSNFGVTIEYSMEKDPIGTAGALKQAESFIHGPFFLGNGDTYLDFDPTPVLESVNSKQAKHVMLLTTPHEKGQEGLVLLDGSGKIVKFLEKPQGEQNIPRINAGIYYLSPDILKYIPGGQKFSLEKEVFPRLIQDQAEFYGVDYSGYFIDIGIPKNYQRFIADAESQKFQYH